MTKLDVIFNPQLYLMKAKPVRGPRLMAKRRGPLGINEMLYRTELKTMKELATACRAGQFPRWRYDRLTGTVLWHRLEFEACVYWHRATKLRARPGQI
jgi:hypothetical protein